jgi:hypothetical protein
MINLWTILLAIVFISGVIFVVVFVLKKKKGSIEIITDEYIYKIGDVIKGKVVLNLKKPVISDKLIVGLRCERVERVYSRRNKSNEEVKETLFDFNQILEHEKEYSASEYSYDFSIAIPLNAPKKLEGLVGTLVKPIQILIGQDTSLRWYLYAELSCEGVNLDKKMQISVN